MKFQITQNFGGGSYGYEYFEIEDNATQEQIENKAILVNNESWHERKASGLYFAGAPKEKSTIKVSQYQDGKNVWGGIQFSVKWEVDLSTLKKIRKGFSIQSKIEIDRVTEASIAEEEILEMWGPELYIAFQNHLDENGWLTVFWSEILENNFSNLDEDWNDTGAKSKLYQLMYNLDFEHDEKEKFLRPIKQVPVDLTPKKLFVKEEIVNHKRYGTGIVKEVLPENVVVNFNGKELKFVTCLFEVNLIPNKNDELV